MHNKAIICDKSGKRIHIIFMWLYLKYLLKDTQKLINGYLLGLGVELNRYHAQVGKIIYHISFLNFLTMTVLLIQNIIHRIYMCVCVCIYTCIY